MVLLVILSLILIACMNVYPPGISQWRGDNRDGHYNETNLLDKWPENGPELLWSDEGLGLGYAAPVVTKDKLFINGEIDSVSHLFAFDLDGYQPYFGVSESLALDDNHVYCYPSGLSNNIVALDRFTGESVWSTPAMKDTSSFCSPIFIDLSDRKIMVTRSHYYLLGIDIDNGKYLWNYKIKGYEAEGDHCNTPIYHDGHIYQVIGDRNSQGTVKLKLAADGISVSEVWEPIDSVFTKMGGPTTK